VSLRRSNGTEWLSQRGGGQASNRLFVASCVACLPDKASGGSYEGVPTLSLSVGLADDTCLVASSRWGCCCYCQLPQSAILLTDGTKEKEERKRREKKFDAPSHKLEVLPAASLRRSMPGVTHRFPRSVIPLPETVGRGQARNTRPRVHGGMSHNNIPEGVN